jgi:hypothetical protein
MAGVRDEGLDPRGALHAAARVLLQAAKPAVGGGLLSCGAEPLSCVPVARLKADAHADVARVSRRYAAVAVQNCVLPAHGRQSIAGVAAGGWKVEVAGLPAHQSGKAGSYLVLGSHLNGKAVYHHETRENVFLFYYDGEWYIGNNRAMVSEGGKGVRSGKSSVTTPDLVASGTWQCFKAETLSWSVHAGTTVKKTRGGETPDTPDAPETLLRVESTFADVETLASQLGGHGGVGWGDRSLVLRTACGRVLPASCVISMRTSSAAPGGSGDVTATASGDATATADSEHLGFHLRSLCDLTNDLYRTALSFAGCDVSTPPAKASQATRHFSEAVFLANDALRRLHGRPGGLGAGARSGLQELCAALLLFDAQRVGGGAGTESATAFGDDAGGDERAFLTAWLRAATDELEARLLDVGPAFLSVQCA